MARILLVTEDAELATVVEGVCRENRWRLETLSALPLTDTAESRVDLLIVDARPTPSNTPGFATAARIMLQGDTPIRSQRALVIGHYQELVGRMTAFVSGSSGYVRIHPFGTSALESLPHELSDALRSVLQMPAYQRIDFHDAYPEREFYRSAFESMQWPVLILSMEGRIRMMNLRGLAQFDYPTHMVIDQPWSMLVAGADREARGANVLMACMEGYFHETQIRMVDRHGREFPALIASSRLYHSSGEDSDMHLILGVYDLTAVETLQRQLTMYQRIDSVERVVSGMAHEFNNLLTAIFGHAELLVEDLPTGTPVRESAEVIRRECARAQDLTSRLLGLSGGRQFVPGPVSCNELILSTQRLMQHSFERRIRVVTRLLDHGDIVRGDAGQLQQVLINLVLNARDALDNEGTITLQTRIRQILPEECRGNREWVPGVFVEMSVSDSGRGIEREVLDRVQEPFFTTKPPGKGSGLGLAIVRGIVRSHNGLLIIESEPGAGTTVHVCLPRSRQQLVPAAPAAEPPKEDSSEAGGLGEGVLIIDDEESVLAYARKVLEKAGYRVLAVRESDKAMETLREHRDELSVVILDLTMDGTSGRDLLMQMRRDGDDIPVILSTGFAHGGIDDGMLDEVQGFIKKPYRPRDLLEQVREVLASSS